MRNLFSYMAAALAAIVLSAPASFSSGFADKAARAAMDAVGSPVGDYTLIDQDGRRFNLKSLSGTPVLLNFVYTGCSETCPVITASLKKAFGPAGADLGKRFTALTIGLDPEADTTERMREFGSRLTDDFNAWRFASADRLTIERLAKDTGFYYMKNGHGYDHLNMVTVIGPDMRVFRQVYGVDMGPRDIITPLLAAAEPGKAMAAPQEPGLWERIKLLCYTYDNATGTFRPDYTFFISVGLGVLAQALLVLVLMHLFRRAPSARRWP